MNRLNDLAVTVAGDSQCTLALWGCTGRNAATVNPLSTESRVWPARLGVIAFWTTCLSDARP